MSTLPIRSAMADPPKANLQQQPKFTELNDLTGEKVGGKVLFATDDWFATAENLLKTEAPVWKEGVFTEYGKWMDGWETRRKRIEGYDWCILQLGVPGVIHGVDVDTSFFTGNYAPRCSIQAACLEKNFPGREEKMGSAASEEDFKEINKLDSEDQASSEYLDQTALSVCYHNWEHIVPLSSLQPGYKTSCHNFFQCDTDKRFTHIRLNMYPDGGIARLRVYGRAAPDWSQVTTSELIDLIAMENGGMCIGYTDAHFGHPRNLIQPGRAETMADGWETARKVTRPAILLANKEGILQVPGTDWCVFRLGHQGIIKKIEIDTNHFKGNFPDSCRIEGCCISEDREPEAVKNLSGDPWRTLLPVTKLSAHNRLFLEGSSIKNGGVISHVRLTMAPDGGISRLRLWGHKQITEISKF